jgi:transposase-like protein
MAKWRSAAERRKLLAEYWRSGATRKEFCRQHAISLTTLESWKRVERKLGQAQPQLLRVAVEAGSDGNPGVAGSDFVLILANGRRIETSWGFDEARLGRLIRVVESV